MLKKVHHINLLVNDLASAVCNYQLAFEIDPDGVPAKYLAQHGQGSTGGKCATLTPPFSMQLYYS